jgi:hypothetical protein
MTRETKLGLVVAGSFLALVGGVVVARLRHVEMPGDGTEVVTATEPETSATPPAPEPEKHDNPVSADAVAKAEPNKMPPGNAQPSPVISPSAPINPPVAGNGEQPVPITNATPPAPQQSAPTSPIQTSETPDPATFVGPLQENANGNAPAPTAVVVNPFASAGSNPATAAPSATEIAPAPAAVAVAPQPTAPPAVDPAPAVTTPDSVPVVKAPDTVPVVKTPDQTPPSPVANLDMPAPPASSPTPTVIKQPGTGDPSPAPPPLNPEVARNAVPTVTVVPASGGGGTNTGGATLDAPRVPAVAPPRDQFTAPARPAVPPEPKRDSYLEEQYRWKASDSFAAISTQYYQTPKYADALMKYNQEYPLATREMRQNPQALPPGQGIWIPPVRILERDYAPQIHDLAPIVPATPTSRPAVEAVAPPSSMANSGFGNAVPQFYRVRSPGESMQEIARRTLSSSGLAGRIQQLNPTLSPDPRLPIPAGTVLRLPGEARVDKADQP